MKLKTKDLLSLEGELYGLTLNIPKDGGVIESREILKGILQHEMNGKLKFNLNRIGREVKQEKDTYTETVKELVKKFGTEKEDGSKDFTEEEKKELDKQHQEILEQEIDLEIDKMMAKITPDDLHEIKTEFNFPILFSLIED
jgi:hypothetical protein